jgi:hypothetical protein
MDEGTVPFRPHDTGFTHDPQMKRDKGLRQSCGINYFRHRTGFPPDRQGNAEAVGIPENLQDAGKPFGTIGFPVWCHIKSSSYEQLLI